MYFSVGLHDSLAIDLMKIYTVIFVYIFSRCVGLLDWL